MIHTRSELIDWIRKNVDDRVLKNAVARGSVEVLGGFDPLPTSGNPGWMARVTSPFGVTYLIAVAWHLSSFKLYWFQAPYIPWLSWIGRVSSDPLYAGDNPQLYVEMKAAHDSRFAQIARCSGLHPETDGGVGEAGTGQALEWNRGDGDVSSSTSGQQIIHNKEDRR